MMLFIYRFDAPLLIPVIGTGNVIIISPLPNRVDDRRRNEQHRRRGKGARAVDASGPRVIFLRGR